MRLSGEVVCDNYHYDGSVGIGNESGFSGSCEGVDGAAKGSEGGWSGGKGTCTWKQVITTFWAGLEGSLRESRFHPSGKGTITFIPLDLKGCRYS